MSAASNMIDCRQIDQLPYAEWVVFIKSELHCLLDQLG